MEFGHKPIMLENCLRHLNIRPEGTYVDMTLGGAGHSEGILRLLGSGGRLIGIDQDKDAIEAAQKRLSAIDTQAACIIRKTNFENLKNVLEELSIKTVDGVLMDIGVSSFQLDEGERGFSYQHDAPLDMRMDRNTALTAREIVNTWSHGKIAGVIREYGEENWASRISTFILAAREEKPIETTGQLVEIIKAAVPASARRDGPHPAKRTFQALRIAVNRELQVLESSLHEAVDVLSAHGRLVVITFHSLEDRIVKQCLAKKVNGCTCPPAMPICACGFKPTIRMITRKPETADTFEISQNPRARSAKLRVAEKI